MNILFIVIGGVFSWHAVKVKRQHHDKQLNSNIPAIFMSTEDALDTFVSPAIGDDAR